MSRDRNGYTSLGIVYNDTVYWKYDNRYTEDHIAGNYVAYDDFCITDHGTQPILCCLGFKIAVKNWDWSPDNVACVFYSMPLPSGTTRQSANSDDDLKTYQQNTIYTTDRGGDMMGNFKFLLECLNSESLEFNTQRFVPYTSSSGQTYFIYAYCYPGRSKQCYLDFVPYFFTKDNHTLLSTMTEFRSKANKSFRNFTDCLHIISMDLKNDHLGIMFINGNGESLYYFHIKAEDLVQE